MNQMTNADAINRVGVRPRAPTLDVGAMPLGRHSKPPQGSAPESTEGYSSPPVSEPSTPDNSKPGFPFNFGRPQGLASSLLDRSDSNRRASRDPIPASSSAGRSSRTSSKQMTKSQFYLDNLRPEDGRAAQTLLSGCLPHEQTPPYSSIMTRLEHAPKLTLGMFMNVPTPMVAGPLSVASGESRRKLVGVCSATAAPAPIAQSRHAHSHSGLARVVCIHEICVDPSYRRQGIGKRLVRTFLEQLENNIVSGDSLHGQEFEVVAAICPPKRVSFFEQFGFVCHGASYIEVAPEPWLEMRRFIHPDIDRSHEASFLTADMAELSQTLPSSMGSLPQSILVEHMSGPHSLGSSDHETGFTPYSPTNANAQTHSPSAMSPKTGSLTNDQILTMLLENASISEGAARDLGISVPSSESKQNPACSFERIFGQAIAGKTASENFYSALVARLVDRNYGLNMHRLYCPNEHCDCVLLNRNSSEWIIRETGPLLDAVPTASSDSGETEADSSPQASNAPWLNSLFQSTSKSVDSIGPLRGFWHVPGPMSFENISFSRDVTWVVPSRSHNFPTMSRSSTASSTDPASESGHNTRRRRSDSVRGSLPSFRRQTRPIEPIETTSSVSSPSDDYKFDVQPGETRVVKYLTCPDCGCGPLGFMILPKKSSDDSEPDANSSDCFVAAFRVRYDIKL